jgi:presenilin-like A22 family membrane protease
MKHDTLTTLKLLAWSFCTVVLGIFLVPLIQQNGVKIPAMEIGMVLPLVGVVLLGAFGWWAIIKYNRLSIAGLYSGFTGVVMFDVVLRFSPWWYAMLIGVLGGLTQLFIARAIRNSDWVEKGKFVPYSNILQSLLLLCVGALLASAFSPIAAFAFLALVAVYDAVAVWKLKTMQKMALSFIEQGVLPGFAVAKEKKDDWALIGGGDIFFIIAVAGSLYKTVGFVPVLIVAGGMMAALVALFAWSTKGKSYPALPYLLVGALVGLGIVWGVL